MPDGETLAKGLVPVVRHLHSSNYGRLVKTKDIQNYYQQYKDKILFASDVTVAMHIAVRDGLIDAGLYTDYPGQISSIKW
jgi:hypothetical protein